jgi:hypothetical protein
MESRAYNLKSIGKGTERKSELLQLREEPRDKQQDQRKQQVKVNIKVNPSPQVKVIVKVNLPPQMKINVKSESTTTIVSRRCQSQPNRSLGDIINTYVPYLPQSPKEYISSV